MCAQRKPIQAEVSNQELKDQLESYRQKALELGASAAEVIPASLVSVDERVRLKCLMPRCYHAGTSPNCPPNTPEPAFMRQAFGLYSWAVLYLVEVENWEQHLAPEPGAKPRYLKKPQSFHGKVFDITGTLESMAFRDGYYLALGFGGGTCKTTLCAGLSCGVLDSRECRFPLRSRPSMEAVAIDAFGLAAKVGWDVYPVCHSEADPSVVSRAISMGIVFIH